jgi:hypothetical protein
MVNSEIQKHTICLGKNLVQKLEIESSTDTLARWIIHYIAEQMIVSESMSETSKAEAKQRCFILMLKFWEHRLSTPHDRYPFKNFKPIFERLRRLDSDSLEQRYFNNLPFQIEDIDHLIESDEIYSWIFYND